MVTKVMKFEMPTLQEMLKDNGGNEDLLEELLCKFRLWLMQQMHLPQDISDQRLKFYICTAKFNFEQAKKNLDTLYTLRNLVPEIYESFDPLNNEIQLCHTISQSIPLPKLTPDKCRVHLVRLIDYDASKYNVWVVLRSHLMAIELRIEEDLTTKNIMIFDCAGANINHIMQYTPMLLKKLDSCLKAYGLRIKAIHLINAQKIMNMILTMLKSIFSAKLFNRIHISKSGMESLYDVIPKSILPKDYGGEQPSMNTLADMWRAKLVERRDWFLEEEKRKSNESLRTNSSILNPDDLFGASGVFRQLQID